jgi:hypothetical protein
MTEQKKPPAVIKPNQKSPVQKPKQNFVPKMTVQRKAGRGR